MWRKSDVLLVGTGLAPLITAFELFQKGLQVVILNPLQDFFLEGSELPYPFFSLGEEKASFIQKVKCSEPKKMQSCLAPFFPGPLEVGKGSSWKSCVIEPKEWIWMGKTVAYRNWIEDIYLELIDLFPRTRILEEEQILGKLVGFQKKRNKLPFLGDWKALSLQSVGLMDPEQYGREILDFLSERLGEKGVFKRVQSLEWTEEGVRVEWRKKRKRYDHFFRVSQGVLLFWTPRMHFWMESQGFLNEKRFQSWKEKLWIQWLEEWFFVSRESLVSEVGNGVHGLLSCAKKKSMQVPSSLFSKDLLQVFREVGTFPFQEMNWKHPSVWFMTEKTFPDLFRFGMELLGWDKMTVRHYRPRMFFKWREKINISSSRSPFSSHPVFSSHSFCEEGCISLFSTPGKKGIQLVPQSDGSVVEIVLQAKRAAEEILKK